MAKYIQRSLEPILKKALKQFPALILTGPRQAGKTTLLKHLFSKTHRYLSLELPHVRAAALADPKGFLELNPPPIIFDEVQYAPELFSYIKEHIDEHRHLNGQFILTGSQNLLLSSHVSESLAGRSAIFKLLPLSYVEKTHHPFQAFFWEKPIPQNHPTLSLKNFWKMILRGSFPELAYDSKKDNSLWIGSYIQTYLERDVRGLKNIGDLTQFQVFLKALATRSGQLLQLSDISKDIGVSVNTIKSWISILEATYQIIIIRPYFKNLKKRLIKTPKIYFTDVGILCYLLGLKDIDHLSSTSMTGAIVETFVFSEIFKRILAQGIDPQIFFFRTSTGLEVDLLLQYKEKLIPIEIKASATPNPSFATQILSLMEDLKKEILPGYVIHLGNEILSLAPKVIALPFSCL